MGETIKFNKDALIEELKQIHKDMVSVYKELFTYKYENNEDFRNFIEKEYRENGIANDDKEKWNDNFCHRTSYTLINKVLFIRICEDKGFMFNPEEDFIMGEPKDPNIGKKLSARGRDRWISLISNYTFGELLKFAFADMKESFKNIALFKEDKYEKLNPTKQELELKFMLDSKEYKKTPIYSYEENVAKIIEKLDTSKFDFNVPVEGNILGDVYEKFMDRETRKAIGQFYTPDFVIEYILNNTVAEADVVENPFVSVLDPACGSGHFLIMAYDILRKKFEESIDKLREKYADVDYVYKNEKMKGKEYWVKDIIHYHILKHCIFGADIDSFAVQLTTINLLLKDLENFTDELNIMECDSLIKWEKDYDWQDLKHQLEDHNKLYYTINYKDIAGIQRQDTLSWDKAEELVRLCEFWAKKYDYVVGNPPYFNLKRDNIPSIDFYRDIFTGIVNISSLFIKKALYSLKECGYLSYIVPKSFLRVESFKGIRSEMIEKGSFIRIADAEQSFNDVGYEVAIFVFKNGKEENSEVCIDLLQNNEFLYSHTIKQKYLQSLDSFPIYLDNFLLKIVSKLTNNNKNLNEISNIFRGLPISINSPNLSTQRTSKFSNKILRGESVWYYEFKKFAYYNEIDEKYRNHIEKLQRKKLVMPNIVSSKVRINATIDYDGILSIDTVTNLILNDSSYSYEEILGIINSKLITFFTNEIIFNRSKLTMHLDAPYLGKVPIPIKNKNNINDFLRISEYVEEILDCKRKKQKMYLNNVSNIMDYYIEYVKNKTINEIKCYSAIKNIDQYVYKIYDLTFDEVNYLEKYDINYSYYSKEEELRHRLRMKNNDMVIDYCLIQQEAVDSLKDELNVNEFINLIKDNSIYEIAEKYCYEYATVALLQEIYVKEYGIEEPWKFYNLLDLYTAINEYLKTEAIEILKHKNKYASLDEIRNILEEKLCNFEELMNIMRKDNPTKKSKDIVKEALNQFADTWNSYTKNINAGKESKELVKYYDNNYYGLSEWDDEIHKEYFIDAIKEYTEISSNEKKARDILKLFEGLNIKDKEDYIEIFINQIKKAFKK